MVEKKLREYFQGQFLYNKYHKRGTFVNNFEKSKKDGVIGQIKKEIANRQTINNTVNKFFPNWESEIKNNKFLTPDIKKNKEKLAKLADYGNKILALIFIEEKLLEAEGLLNSENTAKESLKILSDIFGQINGESEDECIGKVFREIIDEEYKTKIIVTLDQLNKKEGMEREREREQNWGITEANWGIRINC